MMRAGFALARESLVRVSEIAANGSWSSAEEKRLAAELVERLSLCSSWLAHVHALVARARVSEMLAQLPPGLVLSPKERELVTTSVVEALEEFPDASCSQLLWCLGLGKVRRRSRGRKSKWAGADGLLLVAEVDAVLQARGWTRTGKKGLGRAIALMQKSAPKRYGRGERDIERLRKAYYAALPHYRGARGALGNSGDYFEARLLDTWTARGSGDNAPGRMTRKPGSAGSNPQSH